MSTARARPSYKQGDRSDGLYADLEGAVLLTSEDGGRDIALSRMEPPTSFGEASTFDRRPRTHLALSEERTICLHIPDSYVDDRMREYPTFVRELGESLASKLRMALIAISEMAALPLGVRTARRLLIIAEGYGERDQVAPRRIAIRQEQLASMLAVSRQTVNQALKELEARGCVRLTYGEMEIVDVAALKAVAQVATSILPPPLIRRHGPGIETSRIHTFESRLTMAPRIPSLLPRGSGCHMP